MLVKSLILGISGPNLNPEEKKLFLENPVAGFILFRRNIETEDCLKALITDLKKLYTEHEPIILVDQEGGRVARLKPPIVDKQYPAANKFSEMYQQEGDEIAKKAVYDNYVSIMQELKSLGIDSPVAPVADLLHEGANKV